MQPVLEWLDANTWVILFFGSVLTGLLASYIAKKVFDRIATQLDKTPSRIDEAVFDAIRVPVRWGIAIVGLLAAGQVAQVNSDAAVFDLLLPTRNLMIIFLFAWIGMRLISKLQDFYVHSDQTVVEVHMIRAFAKILRASVLITGTTIALDVIGVPMTGVVAFGGVGGLAVGFAAKDMIANFFGALMLYIDKPFVTGDWIRSPDREIEGTVEDIGWRMTTIRTFDKRPLYVPNSAFGTMSVENPSRMTNRRIYETVGVRYKDLTVLPNLLEAIRNMLKNHDEIDTSQTLMVNLNHFAESSVDFFIYTFTKTTVWTDFHEIKEAILLEIHDIIEKHGAETAFPTQTIYVNEADEIAQLQHESTRQS